MESKSSYKYEINKEHSNNKRQIQSSSSSTRVVDQNETVQRNCCKFLNSEDSGGMKMHEVIKILVLGPGNSGKSTILKQMNIIHGKSYPEKERKKFKYYVIANIMESIIRLVNAMRHIFNLKFERELKNEENFTAILEAQQYLDNNNRDLTDWYNNSKKYAECIVSIWRDNSIRIAYQNRNKFYFNDSTVYFIQHIDRISKVNYIPEIDDLLRVRQPTTGILEYTFKLKGAYFMFVDVGGQRSERRKWINCFENVTSMLFVTSMSDYDLTMSPDELKASNCKGLTEINRMKDSLDLFSTLVNWKKKNYLKNSSSQRDPLNQKQVVEETFLFADVSIILFLNKQDLFEEKFYQSSIKYFFEDYNEKSGIEEAKDFIAKKFLACEKSSRKDIYWHYTCALDTKNIETVIAVVRDSILTIMTQKMRIE